MTSRQAGPARARLDLMVSFVPILGARVALEPTDAVSTCSSAPTVRQAPSGAGSGLSSFQGCWASASNSHLWN